MDFAALQHSVFLQALGSAILNSLWQCFILWLIYETISVSYKSASARFKNNLGTMLLFISFAWFLTSFVSKIFSRQNVASIASAPTSFATESQPGIHAVSGLSTFLSYISAFLPYLSVAYIFLLFFLISRLFAAYRYVYFISNRRLVNPTGELQLFASKVAHEIGITKKISVWISHHIDVPATIGFIKPVILIPLASINNLSCHQLEAVILHELAHIKRNDYITNLIISVIETILFFNPFVVLLSNVIKKERENCCDDFVLQYRYDPHSYASALLRLEQSRMSKLKLAIGAVSGKKQLLSRIKRITNSQVVSRQFNYGQKMIALLLVTAIICSVAWLSPEEKKSQSTKVLSKEIKPVPLPKTKSADKARQPVEVIATVKQIENLPAIILKHAFSKNEPAILDEPDNENPPQDVSSDDDDGNKDSDNPDFFKVENNNLAYTQPAQIIQPRFFLDANNFKLPPFANIQNFLLQNMNLNIDFSKIDMGKLNENLQQAYQQIKTVDWNKVQNEINKSFSKAKLGKLSQKEQDAFYNEKAKTLSKLNVIYAQQQNTSKAILEQLKKEVSLNDSLHAMEVRLWNDDKTRVQETNRKRQRGYERNNRDNYYYYNYSNNTAVASNDEEPKAECVQTETDEAPSNSCKKTIRISIKRAPGHTGVLNVKKPFQFSFYKDDEKPNHENVISVEVNN
jgi:beta-lactamase regulating signal transducer with metallopeptidase domain